MPSNQLAFQPKFDIVTKCSQLDTQWGQKVFSQPLIVQVLLLGIMREV